MRSERRGRGCYQRGSAGIVAVRLLAACGGDGSKGQPADETLRSGALLSLTGGWSTLGQTSQAALSLAAAGVKVAALAPVAAPGLAADTQPAPVLAEYGRGTTTGAHLPDATSP